MTQDPDNPRGESRAKQLDRNLIELLNELRVALPGIQVLFAFLLVVPFNQRFADTTDLQRHVYLAALLLTTAASVCLIGPTVHHRIQFRLHAKEEVVMVGNGLAIAGLTFVALAMASVVFLVTDFVFGRLTADVAAAAVAVGFAAVWYVVPVVGRLSRPSPFQEEA